MSTKDALLTIAWAACIPSAPTGDLRERTRRGDKEAAMVAGGKRRAGAKDRHQPYERPFPALLYFEDQYRQL